MSLRSSFLACVRAAARVGVVLGLAAVVVVPGCNCDAELEVLRASLVVEPGEATLTQVAVAQDTVITFQVPNGRTVALDDVVAVFPEGTDPAFRVTAGTLDRVLPGTAGELTVTVRPLVEGTITATLVVQADPLAVPNRVEVPITVSAINAGVPDIDVDPNAVDFDVIGRTDIGRASVEVKNTGIRDLLIDEATLTGDPQFRLATSLPPGTAIAPGSAATVLLIFAPDDVDTHTGNLLLRSNDPDEGEVNVPITARAVDCPTAIASLVDGEVQIEPFDTVRIDGRDSLPGTPGSFIPPPPDGYEWTLLVRPVGSTAVLSSSTAERTELTVDLAGFYQVQLDVFAADPAREESLPIRSCAPALVDIDVVPREDLHVQLVWNHPTADFDLHLMQGGGTPFTHETDCYFSNRHPEGGFENPTWSSNPDENPDLDVDDDEGYGPENINLVHPAPGSRWVVLVHYWNKQTPGDPTAEATLRLFVFGRQTVELTQVFDDDQQLWRAVEIVWATDPLALPSVSQLGVIEPFVRPF